MGREEKLMQPEATSVASKLTKTKISFRQWMFERMKPFITGRTLEIIDGEPVIASVCERNGIKVEIMEIDLTDTKFEERYTDLMGKFETVILMNKGKEITENRILIVNCTKLLKHSGHLFLNIPAHTALYKGLDQGFSNWVDYNQKYIDKILGTKYTIIKKRYLIIKKESSDAFVISGKYSERVTTFSGDYSIQFNQSGLSILVIGRKDTEQEI